MGKQKENHVKAKQYSLFIKYTACKESPYTGLSIIDKDERCIKSKKGFCHVVWKVLLNPQFGGLFEYIIICAIL